MREEPKTTFLMACSLAFSRIACIKRIRERSPPTHLYKAQGNFFFTHLVITGNACSYYEPCVAMDRRSVQPDDYSLPRRVITGIKGGCG
jgi:hypothetical protein